MRRDGGSEVAPYSVERHEHGVCEHEDEPPRDGDFVPDLEHHAPEGDARVPAVHDPHEEERREQEHAIDELEGGAGAARLVEEPVDVEERGAQLPQEEAAREVLEERPLCTRAVRR